MVQQSRQTKDTICVGVDWEPKNVSSHSISLLDPNQSCCTTVPGKAPSSAPSSRLHKYGSLASQPRHHILRAYRSTPLYVRAGHHGALANPSRHHTDHGLERERERERESLNGATSTPTVGAPHPRILHQLVTLLLHASAAAGRPAPRWCR